MAQVTSGEVRVDVEAVELVVRVMFPHPDFPAGPYRRTAEAIVASAAEDARSTAQLEQGMTELETAGFADLDEDAQLAYLRGISTSAFFGQIRAKTILVLYDDPEVWELLGYEGPAFEHGGYVDRGFDDLDWLPAPRIEEAS
jgi:hypothetical protein